MANTYNNAFNVEDFSKQVQSARSLIPGETPSVDFSKLPASYSRLYDPQAEQQLRETELRQSYQQAQQQREGLYGGLERQIGESALGVAGTARMQPFNLAMTAGLTEKEYKKAIEPEIQREQRILGLQQNMAKNQIQDIDRKRKQLTMDIMKTVNKLSQQTSWKILNERDRQKEKIEADYERSKRELLNTTAKFTRGSNIVSGISGAISAIIAGIVTQGQAAGAGWQAGRSWGQFMTGATGGRRYEEELQKGIYV